ncbi:MULTISPECIES: chemotaxis protein CheW [Pseudomonas]|uniref:Chemotaxis protein CheW n=1 Tax=Pseudomonas eucalypticola TaxID=2599595 RepID=A0A7D5D9T4_9PSED|nr:MULTISPECIES: chemotaxis protein CheW [Pseudomonas]QKZ07234.1 chemotaxis protein CheW [Pseudomonas eucalypticola]
MLERTIGRRTTLTALLLPLADRTLVVPNVAVAELIGYQYGQPAPDRPAWHLGHITWRNQLLPLVSFEAACGAQAVVSEQARIVVLNAVGESPLRFIGLLIQGVPRSCRLDSQLSYIDVPLAPLEIAAVQVGEQVARVPDLVGLERLLDEAAL